ncbi:hypothetical protein [Nocardioides sp. WS12]|uniref:hypothetical protein n=1 Tax=Nocardioides sp. WS12 TaxID=2486272 RepID=UPI0015FBFB2C|nr:hypothetical protein [Nocardioides sp. WS12]
MQSEGVKKTERFSTGGMVGGVVGIVSVLVVVVLATVDPTGDLPAWAYAAAAFVVAAIWAVLLRPALVLGEREVEVRNILHTRWIPYTRISEVNVELVTTFETDEGSYVASGFGRSRRKIRRDGRGLVEEQPKNPSMGWLVEQKLQRRIDDAKFASGEDGPIRHERAWLEIATLSISAVATLVLVLVG